MLKSISVSSNRINGRKMASVRTFNGLDLVRPDGRLDMAGTDPFATDFNFIHKRC